MTQQKKHIGYDEQKSNRPVAARGGGGSGGMFRPGGLQGPRGGGGRPRGGPVGTHDARREGDAGHAVDLWKEHERQQRRKRDEGRESDDRFAALPQHQSGVLQPDSAQGRRGVAARDSDPVRFRRDPRLPHDFPDSAGTGLLVERGAGRGVVPHRRARVAAFGRALDLLADGRCGARRPLGPRVGGLRRRPLSERNDGRRRGEGLSGRRPDGGRCDRRLSETFRGLCLFRRRPRLPLHRNLSADAVGYGASAVRNGREGRCRDGDERLQRHFGRTRVGQPLYDDRHPARHVGIRRSGGLGLGRRETARRAGRGRRPGRGCGQGDHGGAGHGYGGRRLPGESGSAGRKRTGAGKGAGRSRAAHPAREVSAGTVRETLYRGAARRAALPVDRGACRSAGAGGREHGIAEKQRCDAACRR